MHDDHPSSCNKQRSTAIKWKESRSKPLLSIQQTHHLLRHIVCTDAGTDILRRNTAGFPRVWENHKFVKGIAGIGTNSGDPTVINDVCLSNLISVTAAVIALATLALSSRRHGVSRHPTGTLHYRCRPLDVREPTEAEHGQDEVAMGRIETQPFSARLLSSSAPSRS